MPPKKSRDTRSSAPTPSPAPRASASRSTRSRSHSGPGGGGGSTDGEAVSVGVVAEGSKGVGETLREEEEDEQEQEEEKVEEEGGAAEAQDEGEEEEEEEEAEVPAGMDKGKGKEKAKSTLEERMEKMKELRLRMNQSTAANRKDLVTDHQKRQVTARELARLEKQRKLAQTLRLKEEADANGEDMERRKAWEWSIEQDERWKKKMDEREERSDNRYHNAEDSAHKLYDRNIRNTKADLLAYERQKEAALGLAPGTLVPANATSLSIKQSGGSAGSSKARGLTLAEDLYRGADTLSYGDSKPSEEAVDRVTAKINKDMDKGKKRNRPKKDEETDVTYINDRNKVFNRKLVRYFDKYTKEIRANFERGTAL